jgi:hypothetical protein
MNARESCGLRSGVCAWAFAISLACLASSPAAAQFNPAAITVDLTAQASGRSASVTTTIRPACTLSAPQVTVSLATLLPAAPVANVNTDAAQLQFGCNTPTALLSIASSGALLNSAAAPTGREATKFTRRLPFDARADLLGIAQASGPSIWVMSDNSVIGPTNLPIGVGTGQRIRSVAISARNISSQGLIPIAGPYTGTICVSVDPAGVANTPFCGADSNIATVQP